MNILYISGSIRKGSTNQYLLRHISKELLSDTTASYTELDLLPMFHPDMDQNPLPQPVLTFRNEVAEADAVIISTPEYLHNIPAVLKNGLEWLSSSGELHQKPVLAITYAPSAFRGQKAMQSLVMTLLAMEARVLTTLELHHGDIAFDENGKCVDREGEAILIEAIKLVRV